MELNHLRYFYEVAKAGSFTAAARKLKISQSALSKAVALLEDREGVKLLQRSKKGVALTAVGAEVYRQSAGIFQVVAEIENTCRGTKETCEGYLRFGASDHLTNYLLLGKLRRMRARHPKVIPSVYSGTPGEVVGMVLNNELEFGLFFTRINTPGVVYESLGPIPMVVVCHPRLAAKGADKSSLRAMVREHGFIGSIKSQYQVHPSRDLLEQAGEDSPAALESNSQEAQKRFCLEGGGIAYLARFMVEKEIASGKLVELPLAKPLAMELLVVKRRGLPLSLSARTFIEMVRAALNQPLP